MATPTQPDAQIEAALITPTCTHVTTPDGLMYATGRVYQLMVDQASANKQQISAVQVAAIYQLDDGVYVQIDKPSEDPKNKTPVRIVAFLQNGGSISMTLDHDIQAACAVFSRLHYKHWEEKFRALLEPDDDDDFEMTEEDLDEVPLEELQAAIARRKR